MKSLVIGVAALLASASASAETLWNNIEAGMTVAQVQALYSDGDFKAGKGAFKDGRLDIKGYEPVPDCSSTVQISFENGKAEYVEVRGKGAIGGNCSSALEEALVAKYGQPESGGEKAGWCMSDFSCMTNTRVKSWRIDGVMMRFHKRDGQGLMSASWVMEYVRQARLGSVGL